MQSRFSAFAVAAEQYLLQTWHPSTRPEHLDLDADIRWLFLDITEVVLGGPLDATGIVEFSAHYQQSDGRAELRERSNFVRQDGSWLYVSGDQS
jgi:SEC-C motif-containing protein